RGRLALDDFEVIGHGHSRIVPEAPLHDLALGQADARLGRPADDLGLEARAEREGAAEEEVARDQRVGDAEGADRRGPAAARLAPVDDVVVQEGGGVDQLERDRRLDRIVAPRERPLARRGVVDEQHDERADALAARLDEVRGDRMQALLARSQLGVEPRLDPDEVLLDAGREGRSGGGSGAVGEGLHGGGEATQRERTSNVKDGCRRGRAEAPEQPSEAVMVAATLRWREAAASVPPAWRSSRPSG